MNDDKYYIPDLEDLRIGYEMEANPKYFTGEDVWKPTILRGVDAAVKRYHEIGMYRTPYLSQEQIENEGWKLEGSVICKGSFEVYIDSNKHTAVIYNYNGMCYFQGECKSINEFRYICKLLKI